MQTVCALIVFDKLVDGQRAMNKGSRGEKEAGVLAIRTLHEFLQPPPLSSVFFGGFHFHDHSNETEELPPVVMSPTSSTLEFLCRFGSA